MIKKDIRDASFFIKIVEPHEIDYSDMNPLHYRDGTELIGVSPKVALIDLSELAKVITKKTTKFENNQLFHVVDLEDIDKTMGEITHVKEIYGFEIEGQKTYFEPNEIIFGKLRPYLNNVAIADWLQDLNSFIGSSEWVRIKPNTYPFYLLFVLKSNYILSQTLSTKGSVRPRLKEEDIPRLKIPKLPNELVELMDNIIKNIFSKRKRSNSIIKKIIKFYDELCNVPKISEDLILIIDKDKINNKRMDTEYYLYEKIQKKLKSINGELIGDYLYESKNKINDYYSDGDSINYITIADIDSNLGEIVNWRDKVYSKKAPREVKAPNRAKMLLKANDILLPCLKGSITSIAWVPEKLNNFIGTNGFIIIKSNKLDSTFIYILLRSRTIQDQLYLLMTGTIMEDIDNFSTIKNILFYKPEQKILDKIVNATKNALETRWLARQSYNLIWKVYHEYCSVHLDNSILKDQLYKIQAILNEQKLVELKIEKINDS